MKQVAILIPTFNNQHFLESCVRSILNTNIASLLHIYVINNGHPASCDFIDHKDVTILQAGKNLGWEGGLKLGLENSKEPFVMFLNDDTYVPQASVWWLQQLLSDLNNPEVGAVGPSTNVVMGNQNIFIPMTAPVIETNMLIGFCVLFKRRVLEEIGGVDDTLPGGDDLDFSIRLRKKGYRLLVDRRVFVYHHGFKTGEKVKGTPDKPNGWNSYEMKEKTDTGIIRKHGFRNWFETIFAPARNFETHPTVDIEGDLIRKVATGGIILDLGVGNSKTVPDSIGVDIYKKGEKISSVNDMVSVADVVADVQESLPFPDNYADCIIGRHILEHMIDPVKALKLWISKLKPGGKLILAIPNHALIESTLMNKEHVHAYTVDSLWSLLELFPVKIDQVSDTGNRVSFLAVATKL